jgi:cytochrome c-type biogenesis protein CcmH
MRVVTVLLLIMLGWMQAAYAVTPDEVLTDPVLEARARHLSKELRCMVCQNQSIDDSDAPLAHDLRVLVRERLTAGDSDRQVIDFLVARYGEFVLLRPPLNAHTVILWFATPGVLLGGALGLWLMAAGRRRRRADPVTGTEPDGGALTAAETAELDELLKSGRA